MLGNVWQALRREVSVGLLLGVVMSIIGFIVAIIWNQDIQIAAVVGLTLPVVVLWAVTVATVVPTVADHFHIDPTVISGPMIATIVDATGLLIYFQLAAIIMRV